MAPTAGRRGPGSARRPSGTRNRADPARTGRTARYRGERLSYSGRSGPVLDDVQIVEARLPVGKLHVLRGSSLRLGKVRVLHGRLVRVEEHDREVAAGLVAVGRYDLPPDGALALRGLPPLRVHPADAVQVGGGELEHLHETHLVAPLRSVVFRDTSPRPEVDQRGCGAGDDAAVPEPVGSGGAGLSRG